MLSSRRLQNYDTKVKVYMSFLGSKRKNILTEVILYKILYCTSQFEIEIVYFYTVVLEGTNNYQLQLGKFFKLCVKGNSKNRSARKMRQFTYLEIPYFLVF